MAIRDDPYTLGSVTLDYRLMSDDDQGTPEYLAWKERKAARDLEKRRVLAAVRVFEELREA